jgi:hypothetical protein
MNVCSSTSPNHTRFACTANIRTTDLNFSRRYRGRIGWIVAAALLFAQAIGMANACVGAALSPTMAYGEIAGMDCAEKGNPNACLQQCMADDQNTAQVQVAVAVISAPAALTLPLAIDSDIAIPDIVLVLARSPDPPPSIRFCSFQL